MSQSHGKTYYVDDDQGNQISKYGEIPYTNKATYKKQVSVYGYIREQCTAAFSKSMLIPVDLINLVFYYFLDYVEIPMEVYSFRGCLDNNIEDGPKWLLHNKNNKESNDYHYWSSRCKNFSEKEPDWIIFRIKQNREHFWLKQFKMKNTDKYPHRGVKHFKLECGDFRSNQWITCKPHKMTMALNQNVQREQTFNIDVKFVAGFKYFRLTFLQNQGEMEADYCKFVVNRVKFLGF